MLLNRLFSRTIQWKRATLNVSKITEAFVQCSQQYGRQSVQLQNNHTYHQPLIIWHSRSLHLSVHKRTKIPRSFESYQQFIRGVSVARGCRNLEQLLSALESQLNIASLNLDDETKWEEVDKALKNSGLTYEMKLGLAHDILSLERGEKEEPLPSVRCASAAVLLHVAKNCTSEEALIVSAQYSLGVLALEGEGVEQNTRLAVTFFGAAAKKGHALSIYQLAGIFLTGKGIKKDPAKAAQLLKLAIDRGLAQASTTLAEMYRDGVGVPQDYDLAFHFFNDAVSKGDSWAKTGLATLYNSGNGTPQDFGKAFRLNFEASQETKNPLAHHNLGTHYFLGKGTNQDFEKARACFEEAAAYGFAHSCFNLGNMYIQGRGCPKDLAKAREYYVLAAKEIPDAQQIVDKIDSMNHTTSS
eukprot:gene5491-7183_t